MSNLEGSHVTLTKVDSTHVRSVLFPSSSQYIHRLILHRWFRSLMLAKGLWKQKSFVHPPGVQKYFGRSFTFLKSILRAMNHHRFRLF